MDIYGKTGNGLLLFCQHGILYNDRGPWHWSYDETDKDLPVPSSPDAFTFDLCPKVLAQVFVPIFVRISASKASLVFKQAFEHRNPKSIWVLSISQCSKNTFLPSPAPAWLRPLPCSQHMPLFRSCQIRARNGKAGPIAHSTGGTSVPMDDLFGCRVHLWGPNFLHVFKWTTARVAAFMNSSFSPEVLGLGYDVIVRSKMQADFVVTCLPHIFLLGLCPPPHRTIFKLG